MPTENRSSNTEMVSLPRELADRIQLRLDHAASAFKAAKPERDQLRAVLARPAEQHQGEPVGWQFYQDGKWWNGNDRIKDHRKNTEDAGYPVRDVFSHADPSEVERLREVIKHSDAQIMRQSMRISNQRAQLAERDALLRKCLMAVREQHCDEGEADFDLPGGLLAEIDAVLLASAEPSAPPWVCLPCKIEQPTDRPCDVCGAKTELEALQS